MAYDLWHVLAADDSDARQAIRTATAVANKRVKDQFGKFLASDTEARFEFVKDEIATLVQATADEYGVDPKPLTDAIVGSLTAAARAPHKTASVVEARKPKLCPYHSEVVDISLADGNPRSGFDAMAQHAFGAQHCKGAEYEGSKCNFKKEFTTQSFWDDKAEKAEQRKQERQDAQAEVPVEELVVDELTEDEPELLTDEAPILPVEEPEDNVVEVDFGGGTGNEPSAVGEGAAEELAVAASTDAPFPGKSAAPDKVGDDWRCSVCGGEPRFDEDGPYCPKHPDASGKEPAAHEAKTADAWGDPRGQTEQQAPDQCQYCQGQGCAHCGNTGRSAKTTVAEALEHVDPTKDTSLKINKDNGHGEQPDAEMDGSPHPTVTVDITEPIIYKDDETPFEGTNAVSEKQDVTKSEPAQKGKGGTFPSGKHADPVTSSLLKEALTARDFVAIAHILATAPGGPNPQLAEHFAQYLGNTNPQFDHQRFIDAASGAPQSGRDNYRDQYGPAVASVADVNENPVREILNEQDDFLPDEVVARLAQRS